MSSIPRVILVTGANQGIGLEIVNQLAQQGHIVAIKPEEPNLQKLGYDNVHLVVLDVTVQSSVDKAVQKIQSEQKHLDVLINNAGITAFEKDLETVKRVFETNFFGVIRVTTAFEPLLKLSSNPVILNVSSNLGSLTEQSNPENPFSKYHILAYNTSKSALNSYTVILASDFKEARVNSIHPGIVLTNLNNQVGLASVQDAAAGVIKVGVLLDKNGPTGKFLDYTGSLEHPW